MGYTPSGGPDGLGVFTPAPGTTADFNKGLELLARMGNTRKGVEADRDAITGAELYAGLLFSYTDKSQIDVFDGSGWATIWAAASAYSPSLTGMTLGSGGTVTAETGIAGGLFWMTFDITLGTGFGFSDPNISVPPAGAHGHLPSTMYLGEVGLFDVSATTLGRYLGMAHMGGSSTTLRILRQATNNVVPITSSADPFAWAAGDRIVGNVRYPVA